MLTFEDFVAERLSFSDGKLGITPGFSKGDAIDTRLGKALGQMRATTVLKDPKVTVYSVYSKNVDADVDGLTTTDILKMLKGKSELGIVDVESLEYFLNRAAILASAFLFKEGFDVITSVQSSSGLCDNFMHKVSSKLGILPHLVKPGAVFKVTDVSSMWIDDSKMSDETAQSQHKILDKIKRDGYFSIQKFKMQFRQFVHGWMGVSTNVAGKHVVVFDDYLSSGSTMTEAAVALLKAGASKVTGITILK